MTGSEARDWALGGRSGFTLLTGTKSGRVIAVLLLLKGLVLVYNVATYPPGRGYDTPHHVWRARSAGLEMDKWSYNPPLYYLPVLPWVDVSRFYDGFEPRLRVPAAPDEVAVNRRGGGGDTDYSLVAVLKRLNVLYVFGAYLTWILGILPVVAGSERTWFLGSLLLLALPGFQKAAVMAHPDVLLLFMSSITLFLTIRWLNRQPPRFGRNLTLAVFAGLTGACRPFAIVPMLFCWALNVGMLVRDAMVASASRSSTRTKTITNLFIKVAVVSLVAATLSSGWWVFRYVHTGKVMDVHAHGYMARFAPLKEDYDYAHYYSTFYLKDLLEVPNRANRGSRPSLYPKHNSFWTMLYSEFWGDHYLYFSSAKNGVEHKLWVKRLLFAVALPLSVVVWIAMVTGTIRTIAKARRRRDFLDPALFISAMFWAGFIMFAVWQGTTGLLPGRNSTIKFLYNTWLVPVGVGTAAAQGVGPRLFWILLALELAVFVAAFPMSLNLP